MTLVAPPSTAPWLCLRPSRGKIVEVRVLVGEGTDEVDDNADAEIVLEDGSVVLATLVTQANIATLLSRWRETGECGGGSYLRVPDMIVVETLAPEAIIDAATALASDPILESLPRREAEPNPPQG